jgi:hypothetical protein
MARGKGWTWSVLLGVLAGGVGVTLFWLYTPYGQKQLTREAAPELRLPGDSKGSAQTLPSQARGARFHLVADGKQVFLADLQNGRVWRYFRQTREEGFSREEEGFLPIAFFYAGQKHYSAAEIEAASGAAGTSPQPAPGGRPPQ